MKWTLFTSGFALTIGYCIAHGADEAPRPDKPSVIYAVDDEATARIRAELEKPTTRCFVVG